MLQFKKFKHLNVPFQDIETVEGKTRYYKVKDELLPSMTSILGCLDDGKGLDEWKKAVGEDEAEKIVKEATTRGNSLHDLSERYLLNNLNREDVKGPGKILFNRNRVHLDKFTAIVGVEVAVYSLSKRYAGRVDLFAFDEDKKFCVGDHKNTRKRIDLAYGYNRKKLFKYMLQTAGYGIAFEEMFLGKLPAPTHGILIVGCHSDSTSTRYRFELEPLRKEFDILLDIYYNDRNKNDSLYNRLDGDDGYNEILRLLQSC